MIEILDRHNLENIELLKSLKNQPVFFAYKKEDIIKAAHLRNTNHIGTLEAVMKWPSPLDIFHIRNHANPRPFIAKVVNDGKPYYKPFTYPDDIKNLVGKTIVHKITGKEEEIKTVDDRQSLFFKKVGYPSINHTIPLNILLEEYLFKDGTPCGHPITFSELECL